jgi:hypothetical protein
MGKCLVRPVQSLIARLSRRSAVGKLAGISAAIAEVEGSDAIMVSQPQVVADVILTANDAVA